MFNYIAKEKKRNKNDIKDHQGNERVWYITFISEGQLHTTQKYKKKKETFTPKEFLYSTTLIQNRHEKNCQKDTS